jgi:hypothetical protein
LGDVYAVDVNKQVFGCMNGGESYRINATYPNNRQALEYIMKALGTDLNNSPVEQR